MMFDDEKNIIEIDRVLEEIDREAKAEDEEKGKGKKHHCIPFADLLHLPPPRYAIKKWLYLDSVIHFFGAPETCKSLILLDMALSLANGVEWRGFRTKACQVVYIAGEGRQGIINRAKAWIQETGGELHRDRIRMLDRATSLMSCESCIEVREAIKEWRDETLPLVVIVDTLARNFGPGDENSTSDMGLVIANIDAYLREPFGAAVCLVHHSGVMDKSRGRGNSSLKAAMDAEYSVVKEGEVSVIECTKMKDFERPPRIAFRVKGVALEGSFDEDGEQIYAPILTSEEPPQVADTRKLSRAEAEAKDIDAIYFSMIAKQRKRLLDAGYDHAPSVAAADVREAFGNTLPPNVSRSAATMRWKRALEYVSFVVVNGHCEPR